MRKVSLDAVYQDVADLGILVSPCEMEERTALIVPQGYLAIDYSKIKNRAQEKEVLMEEIGHFSMNAFYSPHANKKTWAKQEARAKRWVFEKYYPPDDIAILLSEFVTETWEIAEQLELPERFVVEMLSFYKEVRNIDFDALVTEIKSPASGAESDTRDHETNSKPESSNKVVKPQKADYKKIVISHFRRRREESEDYEAAKSLSLDEWIG